MGIDVRVVACILRESLRTQTTTNPPYDWYPGPSLISLQSENTILFFRETVETVGETVGKNGETVGNRSSMGENNTVC